MVRILKYIKLSSKFQHSLNFLEDFYYIININKQKLNNMKKTRNTCNDLYYAISNPTEINIHTGNFCINPKYYQSFDKDFLFEWINPYTGKYETKILPKRYVINHARPCYIWKESELHIGKEFKGMCYLISYRDILDY